MSLVLTWLRLELRQRWRSLVVLAVLILLATGTVLTAVAVARRAVGGDRSAVQVLEAGGFGQPGEALLVG